MIAYSPFTFFVDTFLRIRSQKLMMKLKTGGPEVTVEGDEGTYVCGGVRVTGERRV
jgi:hypothetical protein